MSQYAIIWFKFTNVYMLQMLYFHKAKHIFVFSCAEWQLKENHYNTCVSLFSVLPVSIPTLQL